MSILHGNRANNRAVFAIAEAFMALWRRRAFARGNGGSGNRIRRQYGRGIIGTVFALVVLGPAFLGGCATRPAAPGCVPFARGGQVCLLPPAALPQLTGRHLISVQKKDEENAFIGSLKIDSKTMRLSGASLFGTSLFTIVWDGHAIRIQPSSDDSRARTLVTMVQLAIAAPQQLRKRLHGLSLTVEKTRHGQIRRIHEDGKLIARISKTGSSLKKSTITVDIPPVDVSVRMEPL